MPWEIPNYDSLKIPAAPEREQKAEEWDPNQLELDVDELEQCLPRRR